MRSRRLKAGVAVALLVVVGGVGTAQAANRGAGRVSGASGATAAAGDVTVQYRIASSWGSGFIADVTLTNNGPALSGWTLGWNFPDSGQRVVAAWNAEVTQSGTAVRAKNAAYDASLASGASVRFGFQGSFRGSNPVPTAFTVNGGGAGGTTTTTTASGGTTGTTSRSTTSTTSTSATSRTTTTTGRPAGGYTLPKADAWLDYQIGEPYPLPSGVTVVSRDHSEQAAPGAYSICYLNGFQAQPDALGWWQDEHPELLLRRNGKVVIDEDWDEALLDFSTEARRTALAGIVGGWMDECVAHGFQAVEADNQDSYERSGGLLTKSQALAYVQLLTRAAHTRGLAIAQKNALDLGTAGKAAGFDFVVAEECADYELDDGVAECRGYTDVYGDLVFVIEYSSSGFDRACREYGDRLSIVRRDVNVTAPGSKTYVFGSC